MYHRKSIVEESSGGVDNVASESDNNIPLLINYLTYPIFLHLLRPCSSARPSLHQIDDSHYSIT